MSIIKNTGKILLAAYLFYGTVLAGIPALILLVPLWKQDRKKSAEKEKQRLLCGFAEALQSMKTALRAGYAIENAVFETRKDLRAVYPENEPIIAEFQRMCNEIRMQIPLETIFQNFAERSNAEDIRNFAVIFRTARRTGGDLITIMENTADAMEEKSRVLQEIRAILSAKELEWHIMVLVPFGIILYLKLCFPVFLASLYGTGIGIGVMTAALCVIGAALFMGERILKIEV